ncbi:hypothetical protein K7X08_024263 [Anisodus acutangulus]|uniref:Uncharacterized protein n=1 Tax=Anisodus acutangulus TaxID=402998 RepID=A0A9Q1MCE3_9SOLA|nr:hypothetical protein K7X08_024263 [Anisodus acutangulus]
MLLLFAHNELDQDDREYFNHGFLLTIKQAKQQFAKRLNTWTRRSDSSALMPLRNYSSRWKASMLKRNKKLTAAKQERSEIMKSTNATPNQGRLMMLTNGSSNLMIDSSDGQLWLLKR